MKINLDLPTPAEIADQLLNNAFLTQDQANVIAAEIYQPLKDAIEGIHKYLMDQSSFNQRPPSAMY